MASAYEDLPPQVRAIIDKSAPARARRMGISVEEARELIAKGVKQVAVARPTHGTGH